MSARVVQTCGNLSPQMRVLKKSETGLLLSAAMARGSGPIRNSRCTLQSKTNSPVMCWAAHAGVSAVMRRLNGYRSARLRFTPRVSQSEAPSTVECWQQTAVNRFTAMRGIPLTAAAVVQTVWQNGSRYWRHLWPERRVNGRCWSVLPASASGFSEASRSTPIFWIPAPGRSKAVMSPAGTMCLLRSRIPTLPVSGHSTPWSATCWPIRKAKPFTSTTAAKIHRIS